MVLSPATVTPVEPAESRGAACSRRARRSSASTRPPASANAWRAFAALPRSSSSIPARPTGRSRSSTSSRGGAFRSARQPAVARLRPAEAVRPRSGGAALGLQHRRRRVARRRTRASLPHLMAADDAVSGWKVRRSLTLYGQSEPAVDGRGPSTSCGSSGVAAPASIPRSSSTRVSSPTKARRRSRATGFCATNGRCRSTNR